MRRLTRSKQVIERLGGKCVKCGYSDRRALQVDHKKGNGREEMKKFKYNDTFYRYLLSLSDEELHKDYQCLCANCNWCKRYIDNEIKRKYE